MPAGCSLALHKLNIALMRRCRQPESSAIWLGQSIWDYWVEQRLDYEALFLEITRQRLPISKVDPLGARLISRRW